MRVRLVSWLGGLFYFFGRPCQLRGPSQRVQATSCQLPAVPVSQPVMPLPCPCLFSGAASLSSYTHTRPANTQQPNCLGRHALHHAHSLAGFGNSARLRAGVVLDTRQDPSTENRGADQVQGKQGRDGEAAPQIRPMKLITCRTASGSRITARIRNRHQSFELAEKSRQDTKVNR